MISEGSVQQAQTGDDCRKHKYYDCCWFKKIDLSVIIVNVLFARACHDHVLWLIVTQYIIHEKWDCVIF